MLPFSVSLFLSEIMVKLFLSEKLKVKEHTAVTSKEDKALERLTKFNVLSLTNFCSSVFLLFITYIIYQPTGLTVYDSLQRNFMTNENLYTKKIFFIEVHTGYPLN